MNGRRVFKWLGDKGQRVGLLILLVVIISLYLNIRSYYLQQSTNMPNLISIWPKLYSNTEPASIALGWFNTGKKSAIGGRALLFTVNTTQTKRKKLEKRPLLGSSGKWCHGKIQCRYASIVRVIFSLREIRRR